VQEQIAPGSHTRENPVACDRRIEAVVESIRLHKAEGGLYQLPNTPAAIEDANLARAKARAASPIVDCILLIQEHRLNAQRFKYLPAVSEGPDLDDCHGENRIILQSSLPVHLNMIEQNNGQALSPQDKRLLPKGDPRRYSAETVLRTRPKTYRKIVHLLADPFWSVLQISKACRVSEHIVRAIREREAKTIAERKQRLMSVFANVAELSAERMEELTGKATLRDAGVSAGIATDKLLALTGQMPSVNLAVVLPTDEERAERDAAHARLDALCKRLAELPD
jgi:hypothetical protein